MASKIRRATNTQKWSLYTKDGVINIRLIWNYLSAALLWLWYYISYLGYLYPGRYFKTTRSAYVITDNGDVLYRPTYGERFVNFFRSDTTVKRHLLDWIQQLLPNIRVANLTTTWSDGIVLCALIESLCPGACPRHDMLKPLQKVNNCRLGLRLAKKHLGIPQCIISPEEMAKGKESMEAKMRQLLSLVKYLATQDQDKPLAERIKCVTRESSIDRVIGSCGARGSGLRMGNVGKRSKFTITIATEEMMDLLIEINGPKGEFCSEIIRSVVPTRNMGRMLDWEGQGQGQPEADEIKEKQKMYLSKWNSGEMIIRQRSFDGEVKDAPKIPFDYQLVGEGKFLVSYIPRSVGIHMLHIKWQGRGIKGSPFEVAVNNPREKHLTYFEGKENNNSTGESTSDEASPGGSLEYDELGLYGEALGNKKVPWGRKVLGQIQNDGQGQSQGHKGLVKQGTVTRRRVLKRVITQAGKEIVIQEAEGGSGANKSAVLEARSRHGRSEAMKSRSTPLQLGLFESVAHQVYKRHVEFKNSCGDETLDVTDSAQAAQMLTDDFASGQMMASVTEVKDGVVSRNEEKSVTENNGITEKANEVKNDSTQDKDKSVERTTSNSTDSSIEQVAAELGNKIFEDAILDVQGRRVQLFKDSSKHLNIAHFFRPVSEDHDSFEGASTPLNTNRSGSASPSSNGAEMLTADKDRGMFDSSGRDDTSKLLGVPNVHRIEDSSSPIPTERGHSSPVPRRNGSAPPTVDRARSPFDSTRGDERSKSLDESARPLSPVPTARGHHLPVSRTKQTPISPNKDMLTVPSVKSGVNFERRLSGGKDPVVPHPMTSTHFLQEASSDMALKRGNSSADQGLHNSVNETPQSSNTAREKNTSSTEEGNISPKQNAFEIEREKPKSPTNHPFGNGLMEHQGGNSLEETYQNPDETHAGFEETNDFKAELKEFKRSVEFSEGRTGSRNDYPIGNDKDKERSRNGDDKCRDETMRTQAFDGHKAESKGTSGDTNTFSSFANTSLGDISYGAPSRENRTKGREDYEKAPHSGKLMDQEYFKELGLRDTKDLDDATGRSYPGNAQKDNKAAHSRTVSDDVFEDGLTTNYKRRGYFGRDDTLDESFDKVAGHERRDQVRALKSQGPARDSPTLKVLQSASLKKTCCFNAQKAFSGSERSISLGNALASFSRDESEDQRSKQEFKDDADGVGPNAKSKGKAATQRYQPSSTSGKDVTTDEDATSSDEVPRKMPLRACTSMPLLRSKHAFDIDSESDSSSQEEQKKKTAPKHRKIRKHNTISGPDPDLINTVAQGNSWRNVLDYWTMKPQSSGFDDEGLTPNFSTNILDSGMMSSIDTEVPDVSDRGTQCSANEIMRETNWRDPDRYLKFRRKVIKIPQEGVIAQTESSKTRAQDVAEPPTGAASHHLQPSRRRHSSINGSEDEIHGQVENPTRQSTFETGDSGIVEDSNGRVASRQILGSRPPRRVIEGHRAIYRKPYRGRIDLDPSLTSDLVSERRPQRMSLGKIAVSRSGLSLSPRNSTQDSDASSSGHSRRKLKKKSDTFKTRISFSKRLGIYYYGRSSSGSFRSSFGSIRQSSLRDSSEHVGNRRSLKARRSEETIKEVAQWSDENTDSQWTDDLEGKQNDEKEQDGAAAAREKRQPKFKCECSKYLADKAKYLPFVGELFPSELCRPCRDVETKFCGEAERENTKLPPFTSRSTDANDACRIDELGRDNQPGYEQPLKEDKSRSQGQGNRSDFSFGHVAQGDNFASIRSYVAAGIGGASNGLSAFSQTAANGIRAWITANEPSAQNVDAEILQNIPEKTGEELSNPAQSLFGASTSLRLEQNVEKASGEELDSLPPGGQFRSLFGVHVQRSENRDVSDVSASFENVKSRPTVSNERNDYLTSVDRVTHVQGSENRDVPNAGSSFGNVESTISSEGNEYTSTDFPLSSLRSSTHVQGSDNRDIPNVNPSFRNVKRQVSNENTDYTMPINSYRPFSSPSSRSIHGYGSENRDVPLADPSFGNVKSPSANENTGYTMSTESYLPSSSLRKHVQGSENRDVPHANPSFGNVKSPISNESPGYTTSTESCFPLSSTSTCSRLKSSSLSLDESYQGFGMGRNDRREMLGAINEFRGLVENDTNSGTKRRSQSDSAVLKTPGHLFRRENKYRKTQEMLPQKDEVNNERVRQFDNLPKCGSNAQDDARKLVSQGGAALGLYDDSDSSGFQNQDISHHQVHASLANFKAHTRFNGGTSSRENHHLVLGVNPVESLDCAGIPNVKFTFDSVPSVPETRHDSVPPIVRVTSNDSEENSSFDLNESLHVRFKKQNGTANVIPESKYGGHSQLITESPPSSFDLEEKVHVRFGNSQKANKTPSDGVLVHKDIRSHDLGRQNHGFGRHLYHPSSRFLSTASSTSMSSLDVPRTVIRRQHMYNDSLSSFDDFLNGYLGFVDKYTGTHAWDTSVSSRDSSFDKKVTEFPPWRADQTKYAYSTASSFETSPIEKKQLHDNHLNLLSEADEVFFSCDDTKCDDEKEVDMLTSRPVPKHVTAFGSCLHFGQVATKNNFQVKTESAGNGTLTVCVKGPRPHTVTETSVTYTGDELYEVTYEVAHPGFYIIAVRWSNINIPNSPFICKVTF